VETEIIRPIGWVIGGSTITRGGTYPTGGRRRCRAGISTFVSWVRRLCSDHQALCPLMERLVTSTVFWSRECQRERWCMTIKFNHTIVWARDSQASATFLADVLGLPAPKRWGPFLVVTTANGTNLDFMDVDGEIAPQHYAFSSPKQSSTKFLVGFGHDRFPIGLIPRRLCNRCRARRGSTLKACASRAHRHA
jgi:hypothetical protein